jgi:hypothetical protein
VGYTDHAGVHDVRPTSWQKEKETVRAESGRHPDPSQMRWGQVLPFAFFFLVIEPFRNRNGKRQDLTL